MESPADRIADALERIATVLESKSLHINIDHGHIEHIDYVDHNHIDGDINTHSKTW